MQNAAAIATIKKHANMYVVEFQILIFVAGTYKQVNLLLKISKRKTENRRPVLKESEK